MTDQWQLWEVFVRPRRGIDHVHSGSVHAPDAEIALQHARDLFTRRGEGVSLWVVRSEDIVASSPDKQGPLFDHAEGKDYRYPTHYDLPPEVANM